MLVFLLTLSAGAAFSFCPQYTNVAPGLDYAHLRLTNKLWSIHVARLDRQVSDYELRSTLARDMVMGLSKVSAQMTAFRSNCPNRYPLVAVNGDFFVIRAGPAQGDPRGLHLLDGELVSAPTEPAFWIESSGELRIGQARGRLKVVWPDGAETRLGLNEALARKGATLFTPRYGPTTCAEKAIELTLEPVRADHWLPLRAGRSYEARVRQMQSLGYAAIPPDALVLSLSRAQTNHLRALKPGAVLTLAMEMSPEFGDSPTAIGGWPILLHDGKPTSSTRPLAARPATRSRHPRTAVGFNARYLWLVAVDGRQKRLSVGMTFAELAGLMQSLGCSEALNLDGGGSTTFWLDGQVRNSPSDGRERAVANALVIVKKDP